MEEQRPATDNVLAIISVVFSGIGLLTAACACAGIPGIILALFPPLIGVVTGFIGLSKSKELDGAGEGLAKIGIGLGIADVVLIVGLFCVACTGLGGMMVLSEM